MPSTGTRPPLMGLPLRSAFHDDIGNADSPLWVGQVTTQPATHEPSPGLPAQLSLRTSPIAGVRAELDDFQAKLHRM
jgi:hypothetical protein